MNDPKRSDLLALLPRATAWAAAREREVQAAGRRLTEREIQLARSVEVAEPERIRVAVVPSMPPIDDLVLRQAAIELDVVGPGTHGLTLGHAIYLMEAMQSDERLLRHECRHVYQYEQAGSIEAFLRQYLQELAEWGYDDAPLERDACKWEHGPG